MGKHTKFDDSDSGSEEVERKRHKEEKKAAKKEKRDRSRSPHKERERSPKRDRHGEKNDSRRRDEDNDQGRRRDQGREDRRDDRREDRRDERRDDRNNWKRERSDRRNDFQKRDDKKRLSAEEIAAQRKALWGSKKAPEPSSNAESTSTSSEAVPPATNEKLWSSAIAATGVDSSQANKFMRLMGVKNAPKPTDNSSRLSAEKSRQDKMLNDLEKQYAVARETTHMGRGTGFGFH